MSMMFLICYFLLKTAVNKNDQNFGLNVSDVTNYLVNRECVSESSLAWKLC